MESHSIPQNVTSFEFHLVGDMTLKQFGYLAAGLSIAYLSFMFIFPYSKVFAIPIITTSSLIGAAFAFLPIQDRPLDHWLFAFIKAVFSSTKASWKPTGFKGKPNLADPIFRNRLQLYILQESQIPTVTPPPSQPLPPPPPQINQSQQQPPQTVIPPQPQPTPLPQNLPSDEQLRTTVELAKQAQLIQVKIIEAEKHINQLKDAVASVKIDQPIYTNQLQETSRLLQNLINRAQMLQAQITPVATPQVEQIIVKVRKPMIKVVEPPKQTNTQLLLTSLPNVINGVITDTAGNYLEGVVVVIHNQDGLPVRASKTNKLGQFTGATPLPSGTYTITLEKENLEFDVLQIELKGEVLAQLPIQTKKKV